jgi:hypothetical protein
VGSVLTDRAKRPGRRSISCFALSCSVADVRMIAFVTPQPCICVKHASASLRRCKWVSSTGQRQSGADCAWTHGATTPAPTNNFRNRFRSMFFPCRAERCLRVESIGTSAAKWRSPTEDVRHGELERHQEAYTDRGLDGPSSGELCYQPLRARRLPPRPLDSAEPRVGSESGESLYPSDPDHRRTADKCDHKR